MKGEPIRVLHVLTGMNRAGAETMLMNLFRAVDQDRVQFDFAVSSTKRCDYDDEIEALGGRIIHYPRYRGINHLTYKKWWNDFFRTNPVYKIVHGHIGSTASIYLAIAKRFGCFTIAHSHNANFSSGPHGYAYRVYSYSTRYIADFFIGCSTEALVSRYGKKVAYDRRISCLLNNGIDVEKYRYSASVREEVCRELQIKEGTLVVGTVGRFTKQKNPLFMVEIIEKLKSLTDDFVFLWVGTGEMTPEVKCTIDRKGLTGNVNLLGVRKDVPRLLQAMNVFILPSLFEGLPVVGVEVQAAGVPMLCSENVSLEVKITDCISFLPIRSSGLWAERILNEKSFRRVEGAADDVIRAGYDIKTTAEWLTEFYESKVK